MLKRSISGAVFVLIITLCFVLREKIDYRIFYLLTAFFNTVGTFEVARCLKQYFKKGSVIISTIYAGLFVVLFVLFGYYYSLALLGLTFIILAILNSSLGIKNMLAVIVPLVYPSILLLFELLANAHTLGFIILLLTFVISPLTDTFAYLVGMCYNKIRKGKAKKLCPKLSPKKTIAGAIGGLIGGIVGSILVYFIFGKNAIDNVYIFLIGGVVASIFTQVGDLFESFIKRKVGIKDMGNIMPGHGGVMDRIDGISFAGVVLFLIFLTV